MSGQIFVDESKHGEFLLVAVVIMPADVAAARRVIRGLVMPGQRRLHMKKESDSRRRGIISAVESVGARAIVYNAGRAGRREREAREACLRALVADASSAGHQLLTIEQDDSLIAADRRVLYSATRQTLDGSPLRYQHRRAETELLLALPDAIAWSWARGGIWRDRVRSIVTEERRL